MIKEEKRIVEINKTVEKLNADKLSAFEKITRDLVKLKKIDTKDFYRIIENDRVHINQTLKAICKVFGLNYDSIRTIVKDGVYEIKSLNATIEKLKTEDYK